MHSERPLVFPSLVGPLSSFGEPILALLRIAVGLSLFVHGWYIANHMQETADWLSGEGFSNAMASTWIIMLVQTVAALCLAAGFLTRLVAIPILIFLLNAVVYHWPKGFFWNLNGFEYPLILAIVVLVFVVRGGGRYALDRLLPRSF